MCDVPTPAVSTRPLNSFSQNEANFFYFIFFYFFILTYLFLKGCLKQVPDFFRLRSSSSGFFLQVLDITICVPSSNFLFTCRSPTFHNPLLCDWIHTHSSNKLSLVDRYKETSKQISTCENHLCCQNHNELMLCRLHYCFNGFSNKNIIFFKTHIPLTAVWHYSHS